MSASSSANDLRYRILFTFGLLAVYRFGTFVPLPGIDPEQLRILMEGNQKDCLVCSTSLLAVLLVEWLFLL